MTGKIFSYFFEACLIALIIISPLFYGSLLPMPFIILELSTFSLIVVFLLKLAFAPRPSLFFPRAAILFGVFLLLGVLQLLPLPGSLLGIVSPKTLAFYQHYYPHYSLAHFNAMSCYSFNTKDELIKYCCYFGIFFIVLNGLRQRRQFERVCVFIIIWAVLLCLYGLVRKYLILEETLTASFSVFGNRNHFAAYMVMGASLAIGYAISCTDLFKKIIFLFLGALICASIFLSGSRGGSLSVVAALCGIFFLLQRYDVIKKKAWIVFVGLTAGILLMGLVGFAPLAQRLVISGFDMGGRFLVVRDACAIIKDFPLWGVGLGNFHLIFTLYRNFPSDGFWYYLHNDFIQLIIEAGIIAASAYFLFLALMFQAIFKQLKQRRDHFVLGIAIGGGCGLFGVLLHSFFDFNFHIPAICFLFWLLLGIIYRCAHTHFEQ